MVARKEEREKERGQKREEQWTRHAPTDLFPPLKPHLRIFCSTLNSSMN
jgi:hypothetical protein